jgi:hypothetical protein
MQESTIDRLIVPVPRSQDAMTETRRDIKHDVPDLTLDMAMRVLRSAFAKPMLNEQEAIDLID